MEPGGYDKESNFILISTASHWKALSQIVMWPDQHFDSVWRVNFQSVRLEAGVHSWKGAATVVHGRDADHLSKGCNNEDGKKWSGSGSILEVT